MPTEIPLICEAGPTARRHPGRPKSRPEEEARRGAAWRLVLDDEEARLLDEKGYVVLVIPRDDAEPAFRFPAALDAEDVRNLGVVATGGKETFWFRPDREAIRQVRAYLDAALVRHGPEAIAAYRRWARRQFLVGLMGLVGGPLAAYCGWRLLGVRHMPGKFYVLLAVIAFTGIAQFARGCGAIARVRRLRALEEESWWA